MAQRPSPLENSTVRQSPFRRQNSTSPATVRATTPTSSPSKTNATLSPNKASSLSPEKTSPFVRRPSQISHATERPSSPFARPASSLSIPVSPSRSSSNASHHEMLRNTPNLAPTPLSPLPQPSAVPVLQEPDTPTPTSPIPSNIDGAPSTSEGKLLLEALSGNPPSSMVLRPTIPRTITSSTTSTIRPLVFAPSATASGVTMKPNTFGGGAYNHIPQPLLHSMRESFEVLDSNNTGMVNSAAVSEMLSQLGSENTFAALKDFFPPSGPPQLNLARYLDVLSGPLADLSQPEELRAAFEAFDVDDSGQIDVNTLREALLYTAPQPGEDMVRLSERDVDSVLGEFSSRRTFGAKGLNVAKSKGDVFRYRDFMVNISGGGANMLGQETGVVA